MFTIQYIIYLLGAKEPKITFTCLIIEDIKNLITFVPKALLFCGRGWAFDIRILTKTNLERKKFRASDWL